MDVAAVNRALHDVCAESLCAYLSSEVSHLPEDKQLPWMATLHNLSGGIISLVWRWRDGCPHCGGVCLSLDVPNYLIPHMVPRMWVLPRSFPRGCVASHPECPDDNRPWNTEKLTVTWSWSLASS